MTGASDILAVIGGVIALLTTFGGGIVFVWNKVEARLQAIERKLEECERREIDSMESRATMLTVIELLWARVRQTDPNAEVLDRVQKLLDKLKPASGGKSVKD